MNKGQTAKAEKTPPRATYQDVLDAPPHMVAEIVDGTLYTQPRPTLLHSTASSALGIIIGQSFRFGRGGPGGWWILFEPELHFDEDILVPDIAGWRRERMLEIPTAAYITLAPDWVCEVLSPSTRKLDLGHKQSVYARESVAFLWFVDPSERSLEAYELHKNQWVLIDRLTDDAKVSLPPFEAIRFDLGDLWPPHVLHKSLPGQQSAVADSP